HFGIDCPRIFQRSVLRLYRINRDSLICGVAIPQDGRRGKTAAEAAVAAAEPMLIGELVIKFDIELVVRGVDIGIKSKIVELSRKIRLGIEIDDLLADSVDLVRRNYVEVSVVAHLRSARTIWLADDGIVNRIYGVAEISGALR